MPLKTILKFFKVRKRSVSILSARDEIVLFGAPINASDDRPMQTSFCKAAKDILEKNVVRLVIKENSVSGADECTAVASKALRPTSMKPPRSLPHRSALLPPTEWVPNQKKLEVKLPEN